MNKLPDINYALMAQLSYLNWNNLKDIEEGTTQIKKLLFIPEYISQIKTDFYNDPDHYPNNEKSQIKKFDEATDGTLFKNLESHLNKKMNEAFYVAGNLPAYTYHEEDKRLFLVYSLEKGKDGKPLFENIVDGWEYLDCATGTSIQKEIFGKSITIERGFFGVAFQRGNDIMIAYRGTEFNLSEPERDLKTDANIYFKETDIQQVEAVLFYEYIKTKYGAGKNIYITGHSLAGALAQYVSFYMTYFNEEVSTITWNGLGAYDSVIPPAKFSLTEELSESLKILKVEQDSFRQAIYSIDESKYGSSKKRLIEFYSNKNKIIEHRNSIEQSINIINYYMDEDFVAGRINTAGFGKKILVNVKEKTLNDRSITCEDLFNIVLNPPQGMLKALASKFSPSLAFHNLNNFLVFMGDDGNITSCVIRKEFRKNALKTVVDKKIKSYSSLFKKGKEIELIKIYTDSYNVHRDILNPSNRVIGKGTIVSISSISKNDLLFVESFEDENKFMADDMQVEKEDKIEGQRRYKGKIILGEYNNIASLGGIIGKEPLEIKVYVTLPDKEETQETSDTVSKGNDYQKEVHGIK